MTIRTKAQLNALPMPLARKFVRKAPAGCPERTLARPVGAARLDPTWRIPPPKNNSHYEAAEVAELLGVALGTVRDWISRGKNVEGETIRLQSLEIPRGRIAPPALRRFLSATNSNIPVEIRTGGER